MKKFYFLLVFFFVLKIQAQEYVHSKTMGFYVSPSLQAGYNLKNKSQKKRDEESIDYNAKNFYYPNDFTYGIGVVGGYQFLPFMGIGTGLKYNFVADNIHTINWVVQPKFFFGKDNDKLTLELEYGKQINHSNLNNTSYYGGKLAYQAAYSKRLNQEFGIFLYGGNFDVSNVMFIGLSFQAVIFSNKNYTSYAID